MQDDFTLKAYDYSLPEKNIAQHPSEQRDTSRLMVLNRSTGNIEHKQFFDIIDYCSKGDIVVVNDTRVFPARLFGKKQSGGKVEVFLLQLPTPKKSAVSSLNFAEVVVLIKSSKRPKTGTKIFISENLQCTVMQGFKNGKVLIELQYPSRYDIMEVLSDCGSIPLPPYIERSSGTSEEDRERYQTVFANKTGAVAAPTAGLHFTRSIIEKLNKKGVELATLTLHVGYGTFAPVRSETITDHHIHKEWISLDQKTAEQINRVKKNGGRVWAVGTTTVRALEFSSDIAGKLQPIEDWCDLYIVPGYRFKVIDNLITNFHLPQSSLLFLVSALCGRTTLLGCYREAIARGV